MKLLFKEVPSAGSSTMRFDSAQARKIRCFFIWPNGTSATSEEEPGLSLGVFLVKFRVDEFGADLLYRDAEENRVWRVGT